MKQLLTLAVAALSLAAQAQTLNVVSGSVTYAVPAAQAGEMVYSDGTSVTILGKTLAVSDIDRMFVDNSSVEDNTVIVTYDGTSAAVVIAGNIMQYVDATVQGAHVSIAQSTLVGDETCGEITYALSGSSEDGGFYMTGDFKATVEINGLTITNPSGAPIDIQNGKRIEFSVKKDSKNVLTDCAGGSQKGCIVCKGHLELKGKGELTVNANTGHGIYAKEYIEMKNCAITMTTAVKDGVNCNQYFYMESGSLTLNNVGDDGIQVSFKDDTDREAEDTGSITIIGGTITATTTATAAKAIKADGDIVISGGELNLTTTGHGEWDEEDVKTKASACIGADGNVTISGGVLNLTSTGGGGKGISNDVDLEISGGTINITTSGGVFAYVNGKEYTDYTGNTDNLDSDYKSSPKGIKVDGNITISGGDITITTSDKGGEGIESKATLHITGGNIIINAYDDGINATTDITIDGGRVYSYSTNNDGIDSNGTININSGLVIASGTNSPEEGLDCDQSTKFKINGGVVIGCAGAAVSPSTASAQRAVIYGGLSATQGKTLAILNADGSPILSFEFPRTMNSTTVLFSSPDLVAGTYTVSTGGTFADYTDTWQGWYDGGTYSGGTQVGTFTSSSTVTTVGGSTGPGGGPGGGRW